MYILTYLISFSGITPNAILYEIMNVVKHPDTYYLKAKRIKFIRDASNNPYGNIYFAFISKQYSFTRKSFVETSLKPLWIIAEGTIEDPMYAFKVLYHKQYYYSLLRKLLPQEIVDITFKEYMQKPNFIFTRHYIITSYAPDIVNVYLVKPLNEREAISIIADYQYLVLWESI
jgi:hypothetical protein